MNFKNEFILENERVKLLPLNIKNGEELIPFSIHEPELWRYALEQVSDVTSLETYVKNAIRSRENKTGYPFIVFDKRSMKFAGSTRFYDYQENHQSTQLGFTWYGKAFQGTGLNQQCKYLLLSFAFEQLGLERVEFRADKNNLRSIAAMKKIGCTVEGVLRSNCSSSSGRRDSIVLSILRQEWLTVIKPTFFD